MFVVEIVVHFFNSICILSPWCGPDVVIPDMKFYCTTRRLTFYFYWGKSNIIFEICVWLYLCTFLFKIFFMHFSIKTKLLHILRAIEPKYLHLCFLSSSLVGFISPKTSHCATVRSKHRRYQPWHIGRIGFFWGQWERDPTTAWWWCRGCCCRSTQTRPRPAPSSWLHNEAIDLDLERWHGRFLDKLGFLDLTSSWVAL